MSLLSPPTLEPRPRWQSALSRGNRCPLDLHSTLAAVPLHARPACAWRGASAAERLLAAAALAESADKQGHPQHQMQHQRAAPAPDATPRGRGAGADLVPMRAAAKVPSSARLRLRMSDASQAREQRAACAAGRPCTAPSCAPFMLRFSPRRVGASSRCRFPASTAAAAATQRRLISPSLSTTTTTTAPHLRHVWCAHLRRAREAWPLTAPHCRADYTKDNAAVPVVDQSGAVRFLAASLLHMHIADARTHPATDDRRAAARREEGGPRR